MLSEGRIEDVMNKYEGQEEIVKQLVDADPSGNLKYLDWMARQVVTRKEPPQEVSDLVKRFLTQFIKTLVDVSNYDIVAARAVMHAVVIHTGMNVEADRAFLTVDLMIPSNSPM